MTHKSRGQSGAHHYSRISSSSDRSSVSFLFLLRVAPAIAKQEGGNVTVIAPGKPQERTDIAPGGRFSETTAKLPPTGKVTVLITLSEGAKSYSVKFNFSN